MVSELATYNYIIALLEAAKKAAKKLKKKKKKKLMEQLLLEKETLTELDAERMVEKIIRRAKISLKFGDISEASNELKKIIELTPHIMKEKYIFRLKPAMKIVGNMLTACEKGDKSITDKINCEEFTKTFKELLEKYEALKEKVPFYKLWYYWFMTLPLWQKILVVIGLLVVLFLVLYLVVRAASKAYDIIKRLLKGDSEAVAVADKAANHLDVRTKAAIVNVGFSDVVKSSMLL